MGFKDFVIDRWANLSHKTPMQDGIAERATSTINGWTPRGWVGEEHRHRLAGYITLSAYLNNVSRHFLNTTDPSDIEDRREYGDPAMIRDQIVSAVLGETQSVVVRDADRYDPDLDGDPERPEDADETWKPDESDLERRRENATYRALAERQEWLQEWAESVHLELRMVDNETNAVGMGDAAILLGWDDAKQRVVPAVMDPGFYFPVIPDSIDSYDYPERVHFAWELPGDGFADGKPRVRRITYQLTTLAPLFDEDALADLGPDDDFDSILELPENSRWDVDDEGFRQVVRDYPWRAGDPSTVTCTVTDATWVLDTLKDAANVDLFGQPDSYTLDDKGEPIIDRDLQIDFVPVIHVPNTPPGGEHYGESSIARVLQILDDIQSADTDAQAASATTGSPITWSSGPGQTDNVLTGVRNTATQQVKPGTHWDLGSEGQAGVIDTSSNLAATREYVKHLLDRLSVNAQLPAVLLGTVKPSEVPSGLAMQLSFGPLASMIRKMRLVRAVKYPLMLKMVQRLAQANGVLDDGPTPYAEIQLGSFLPTDQDAVLKRVTEAYAAKLISLETAVTAMLEVGFSIDDVAEEIVRIEQRDFAGAGELADATGDVNDAREFLGKPRKDDTRAQAAAVIDPTTGLPVAGGTGVGVPAPTDSGAGGAGA